jgi:hypothetical protein
MQTTRHHNHKIWQLQIRSLDETHKTQQRVTAQHHLIDTAIDHQHIKSKRRSVPLAQGDRVIFSLAYWRLGHTSLLNHSEQLQMVRD